MITVLNGRTLSPLQYHRHFLRMHTEILSQPLRCFVTHEGITGHFNPVNELKNVNTRLLTQSMTSINKSQMYGKLLHVELMEECGITLDQMNLKNIHALCCKDVQTLKQLGYIEDKFDVMKSMRCHLEEFPFDENLPIPSQSALLECLSQVQRFIKNHERIHIESSWSKSDFLDRQCTIYYIKLSIQRQYLAWKLNTSLHEVDLLSYHFLGHLYSLRSMSSLKRMLHILEHVLCFSKDMILRNFVLLSFNPYKVEQLMKTVPEVAGQDWPSIAPEYPFLLNSDADQLLKVLIKLKEMEFPDERIREAIPRLADPEAFMSGIAAFNEKELKPFKSHPNIIQKVLSKKFIIERIKEIRKANFFTYTLNTLLGSDANFKRLVTDRSIKSDNLSDITWLITNELQVPLYVFKKRILRYKYRDLVPLLRVKENIEMLTALKFSKDTILESVEILLYPSEKIHSTLKYIETDPELESRGCKGGFVHNCKNKYRCSDNTTDRRLALCLYMMEKEVNFSKEYVLHWEANT